MSVCIIAAINTSTRDFFLMQIQLGKSAGVSLMAVSGRMDAVSSREFDQAFDELQKNATRGP